MSAAAPRELDLGHAHGEAKASTALSVHADSLEEHAQAPDVLHAASPLRAVAAPTGDGYGCT